MTRRFWISLGFTIPTFALAMADLLPGKPVERVFSPAAVVWIELVLASPVVLWGGWPFFRRGWDSIISRHLNMFTLIALGTGAAYGYSLMAGSLSGAVRLSPWRIASVLANIAVVAHLCGAGSRGHTRQTKGDLDSEGQPAAAHRPRERLRRRRGRFMLRHRGPRMSPCPSLAASPEGGPCRPWQSSRRRPEVEQGTQARPSSG